MADNYLEYRFEKVFGKNSSVDPETGYAVSTRSKSGKSASAARKTVAVKPHAGKKETK